MTDRIVESRKIEYSTRVDSIRTAGSSSLSTVPLNGGVAEAEGNIDGFRGNSTQTKKYKDINAVYQEIESICQEYRIR